MPVESARPAFTQPMARMRGMVAGRPAFTSRRGMGADPIGGDTGTPYTATLGTGVITTVKTQLGAWGKKVGKIPGYPGIYDLNDVIDEAFLNAVREFQTWSNVMRGSTLRTDGRFDEATHMQLNTESSILPTSPPTPLPKTTLPTLPTAPPKPTTPTTPSSSAGMSNKQVGGALALAAGAGVGIGAFVLASKRKKGSEGLAIGLSAIAALAFVGGAALLSAPKPSDGSGTTI